MSVQQPFYASRRFILNQEAMQILQPKQFNRILKELQQGKSLTDSFEKVAGKQNRDKLLILFKKNVKPHALGFFARLEEKIRFGLKKFLNLDLLPTRIQDLQESIRGHIQQLLKDIPHPPEDIYHDLEKLYYPQEQIGFHWDEKLLRMLEKAKHGDKQGTSELKHALDQAVKDIYLSLGKFYGFSQERLEALKFFPEVKFMDESATKKSEETLVITPMMQQDHFTIKIFPASFDNDPKSFLTSLTHEVQHAFLAAMTSMLPETEYRRYAQKSIRTGLQNGYFMEHWSPALRKKFVPYFQELVNDSKNLEQVFRDWQGNVWNISSMTKTHEIAHHMERIISDYIRENPSLSQEKQGSFMTSAWDALRDLINKIEYPFNAGLENKPDWTETVKAFRQIPLTDKQQELAGLAVKLRIFYTTPLKNDRSFLSNGRSLLNYLFCPEEILCKHFEEMGSEQALRTELKMKKIPDFAAQRYLLIQTWYKEIAAGLDKLASRYQTLYYAFRQSFDTQYHQSLRDLAGNMKRLILNEKFLLTKDKDKLIQALEEIPQEQVPVDNNPIKQQVA